MLCSLCLSITNKLNVTKSHGLLLGCWKDRVALPIQLNWSKNFITVLGCWISNDNSVDWVSLLDRFSGQLALWKHCQLSESAQHIEAKHELAAIANKQAMRQRTARQAEYAENVAHLATQRDPALRDGVLTAMKMVMRQTHAATPHRLSWLE